MYPLSNGVPVGRLTCPLSLRTTIMRDRRYPAEFIASYAIPPRDGAVPNDHDAIILSLVQGRLGKGHALSG